MKRKVFVKEYFTRIAFTVLLLGVIFYTVGQAMGTGSDINTTPAREIEDRQILTGTAYLFREETVLTAEEKGLVLPVAKSGTKVGKSAELAEVWTGNCDTSLQKELDDLNRSIELLEASLPSEGNLSYAQSERNQAVSGMLSIQKKIRSGDWSGIGELEKEILIQLNRAEARIHSSEALQTAIEEKKQARDSLLTGQKITVSNTGTSGYFYDRTYVDGKESVFSVAELETLNSARLEELIATPAQASSGTVIGKLCASYEWYLAMPLLQTESALLTVGNAYDFRFSEVKNAISLTCIAIHSDGSGAVGIFLANEMPSDFTPTRVHTVEIQTGTRTGIYIPEDALRTENGERGVYVFTGSTVEFKRVEISYTGDGYAVAKLPEIGQTDMLSLNDLIILSGKNLFDGKVIK